MLSALYRFILSPLSDQPQQTRRDFVADLPPELGHHILSSLDDATLQRAAQVSRVWRDRVASCPGSSQAALRAQSGCRAIPLRSREYLSDLRGAWLADDGTTAVLEAKRGTETHEIVRARGGAPGMEARPARRFEEAMHGQLAAERVGTSPTGLWRWRIFDGGVLELEHAQPRTYLQNEPRGMLHSRPTSAHRLGRSYAHAKDLGLSFFAEDRALAIGQGATDDIAIIDLSETPRVVERVRLVVGRGHAHDAHVLRTASRCPDAKTLALVTQDGVLSLLRRAPQEEWPQQGSSEARAQLPQPMPPPWQVAARYEPVQAAYFGPDGDTLFVLTRAEGPRFFPPVYTPATNGTMPRTLPTGMLLRLREPLLAAARVEEIAHINCAGASALAPDGRWFAAAGSAGPVLLVDLHGRIAPQRIAMGSTLRGRDGEATHAPVLMSDHALWPGTSVPARGLVFSANSQRLILATADALSAIENLSGVRRTRQYRLPRERGMAFDRLWAASRTGDFAIISTVAAGPYFVGLQCPRPASRAVGVSPSQNFSHR